MNTSPTTTHKHAHHHEVKTCCAKEKSKFDMVINVLEKISAVALGVFSAIVDWKLFVPFFFVGTGIGIYSYIQDSKVGGHVHPISSCANGLLEQLTGVKLPPVVSLAANIAVTVCHIDHHSTVFVPVIGVSLGNWIGKMACHYGVLAYRKFHHHHEAKHHVHVKGNLAPACC